MKYKRIYDSIILNRINNPITIEYGETHHIVPKSLGGTNERTNLVKLTAREHFVCHLLLTKIHPTGTSHHKMVRAVIMMMAESSNQSRHITSRTYQQLREDFSQAQSASQGGTGNSQFGTKWINNKILKISKKVPKSAVLESGWDLGRIIDFSKYDAKQLADCAEATAKSKVRQQKVILYSEWYKLYQELGFIEFVNRTGYNKSQANLVTRFAEYVVEYQPQNGKKRGTIPRGLAW